jgi:cytoskeleton protein RodZ
VKPASTETVDSPATAAAVAERLRAARAARSLSVDDAAEALRLDREVVLALEAAEFDSLGAAVFVKGYLRAYARLLGLNEAEVVAGCQLSEPDPEEFRHVSKRREVKPGLNLPMLLLGGALMVLVLAGLLALWPDSDPPAPTVASRAGKPTAPGDIAPARNEAVIDQPTARTTPQEPAVAAPVVQDPLPAATPEPAPPVSPRVTQAPVEPAAVTAPPAEPATVSLELRFADECWVEISDARRRLLYGLEKPGSVRRFDAILPVRFYLGKTDAVAISLAGVTYNVPPEVRTGRNTARFVVAAEDLQLPQP